MAFQGKKWIAATGVLLLDRLFFCPSAWSDQFEELAAVQVVVAGRDKLIHQN